MHIVISPTYSDIFEEPIPDLKELLKDIPSKVTISLLSLINSHLFLTKGNETQSFIFNFILSRQSNAIQQKIYKNTIYQLENRNNEPIEFFTFLYSLEFIHYELLNYRDFDFVDTTPLQELNFLKAYFVIGEQINNKYDKSYNEHAALNIDYFQKSFWPSFTYQFEVNNKFNPFTGMIKGVALFNYLEFHTPFKKYVRKFLDLNEKDKSWNYIIDLINLVKYNWDLMKQKKDDIPLASFSVGGIKGFKSLFEHFTIDLSDYLKKYSKNKKSYTGLKDKPLLKIEKDKYIITNWFFITNKLYDGLVFDFYNYSGIDKEYDSFLEFKKMISYELIEKFLFRKVIEKCFQKKYIKLLFDNNKIDGMPDAYVRDRQCIYLFEIKDAFFPAEAADSMSHKKIKDAIDLKYNNVNKGTGQIIKQIEYLRSKTFEEKSYEDLSLKPRNLIIYPIIIYTDKYFSIPGFNYYLNSEFREKIQEKKLSANFKVIKDLTFINLSFFIDHINVFGKNGLQLDNLINDYHKHITNSKKRLSKHKVFENLFSINDNFEIVIRNKYNAQFKKSDNYFHVANEVFNLTKDLD